MFCLRPSRFTTARSHHNDEGGGDSGVEGGCRGWREAAGNEWGRGSRRSGLEPPCAIGGSGRQEGELSPSLSL
jgi:hypothetical protein